MKTFLFIPLICFLSCKNDLPKQNERHIPTVFDKYDSISRQPYDTTLMQHLFAIDIAKHLTQKYGYGIYGSSGFVYSFKYGNVKTLSLYSKWLVLNKDIDTTVFNEVKESAGKLGFCFICFAYQFGQIDAGKCMTISEPKSRAKAISAPLTDHPAPKKVAKPSAIDTEKEDIINSM